MILLVTQTVFWESAKLDNDIVNLLLVKYLYGMIWDTQ